MEKKRNRGSLSRNQPESIKRKELCTKTTTTTTKKGCYLYRFFLIDFRLFFVLFYFVIYSFIYICMYTQNYTCIYHYFSYPQLLYSLSLYTRPHTSIQEYKPTNTKSQRHIDKDFYIQICRCVSIILPLHSPAVAIFYFLSLFHYTPSQCVYMICIYTACSPNQTKTIN
ncbi:hypothetical protein J3Q64DRAFT_1017359 [Phycomyces blakesleeanus]|uniref:Transmembrane protein n=1 Tax=Phycomyces blakesleeanus TaxID=4837 RepID=A0ABR3BBX9_PHYBL